MIPESRFGRWGLFGTAVYLFIIAILVVIFWESFKELEPNSWGDFLAGTFGPLALGWLVLGFFQQGYELRNSVKTLELQAKELRNSVEQQKAMVEVSRQSMDLKQTNAAKALEDRKLAITPKLTLTSESEHRGAVWEKNLTLTNVGGNAKSLSVQIDNSGSYQRSFLGNGESWILQSQAVMSLGNFGSKAVVSCLDQEDNHHSFSLGVPF